MNKFKVEFINPGYGFKNYKIGEITVYTVRLRFTFKHYILSIFSGFSYNGNKVICSKVNNNLYISYDTTNWKTMEQMRYFIWDACRKIAQHKLDAKYGQTEINF